MRLVVRLALILLAVTLLPLGGLGFLVVGLLERSITAQVRTNHEQLAGVARDSMRLYMETSRGKLKTIAAIVDKMPRGKSETKFSPAELNRLLEPPDIFVELAVYHTGTVEQQIKQVGQSRVTGYNKQQQEYQSNVNPQREAQQMMAPNDNNFLWSKTLSNGHPMVRLARAGNEVFAPALETDTKLPVLPMAVPLDKDGDDIMVAKLDFTPVWKQFGAIAREREIVLVDSVGNALLDTGELSGDLIETRLPAGHADWSVIVREPKSAAYAPLQQARMQAIGWIGGAGVVAILFSVVLAAFIVRPVRALTAAADRIGTGDLTARTNITRSDEIGRLAKSFDQMAMALQQLDTAKSDFVAHVSHELRTPLTSMKLSVANMLDGIVGPLDAKQEAVLARMRGDLDRLIHMVNELLDIAKLEAGKVTLSKEKIDAAEIAHKAVETLRPIAEKKGIAVTLTAQAAPIDADRAKLHEIVVNLVDNAIKFTPAGGRVDVDVAPRKIVVRDTGCGIAPQRLAKVFDKFNQVNANTGIPGAGLGLSITKKLVELHGGKIEVASDLGKGTTFTVSW